jgi:hypothetical protein
MESVARMAKETRTRFDEIASGDQIQDSDFWLHKLPQALESHGSLVISFCIASRQLGAAVSHLIHNYCDVLHRFSEGLGYVGLERRTTANSFRVQASNPFTLLLLI